MTDKPILFSGPMVRALIAGTKTQTRRVFKNIEPVDADEWHIFNRGGGSFGVLTEDVPTEALDYLRIAVGDRLWVREKHWGVERLGQGSTPHLLYDEEWKGGFPDERAPLRPCGLGFGPHPSIHMPRWASRITLTVTDVRVERLQDISVADAEAEGALVPPYPPQFAEVHAVGMYRAIWDGINGEGAWDANPWVAAYTFTVAMRNIDAAAS